ncbi:MAG TPA: GTPase domain-containing protein, partial [Burkholderiaceae bacterium]
MSDAAISLSLVSHTNAGKTTLARTLLGRDVGQVRDAPHVTEFADVYTMLETPQGERLLLWDTPGFGDSVRLVKRLRQSATPLGWFLSAVWDRWRDRPFWASQQALRNVRDEADVMLYLVNAAEAPESAAYVAAEMELLAWVGKPVIVLLNQLGPPREAALEAADIARWRRHLAAFAPVREVLPLDAFARCWVQELTLLRAIESVLPDGEPRARMARLRALWQAQREQTFDAAMRAVAASLARLAQASEPLPDTGGVAATLRTNLRHVGAAIGLAKPADDAPAAQAQRALAQRLDAEVRANTRELIELHGLEGDAHEQILTRLATHYELRLRL